MQKLSRRNFLKKSSLATTLLGVPGVVALHAEEAPRPLDTERRGNDVKCLL